MLNPLNLILIIDGVMSRRNDNKEVAGKKEGKISQRKGGKMLIKGKKKKHEEKFEEKEIKNKIGPKTFD